MVKTQDPHSHLSAGGLASGSLVRWVLVSPAEGILLRHLVVLTFLARSLDVQVWFWVSEQVGNRATHRKTGFKCEVGDLGITFQRKNMVSLPSCSCDFKTWIRWILLPQVPAKSHKCSECSKRRLVHLQGLSCDLTHFCLGMSVLRHWCLQTRFLLESLIFTQYFVSFK